MIWLFIILLPKIVESENSLTEDNINITNFISNYGYPVETHEVLTEDGYFLTVFRIPHSRNNAKSTPNEHPVLMNHALIVSAEVYLLLGPNKSLGFVLADNGYDVWLMNSRGVGRSKRHKNLDGNDKKFWQFSWHEIGAYDIPAVIDYILETTSKSGVHYVGHSQGTTSLFVMGSERPEFNSKIKVMIALAPGARYKYVKNVFLKIISPFYALFEALSNYLKIYELPPSFLNPDKIRVLLKKMCFPSSQLSLICKFVTTMYSPNANLSEISNILSGVPASFSVKQPLHYAQLIATGNFQQYDWGSDKNLKKYGTPKPPLYNLKNITFPVAAFWGPSDEFVAEEDLQFLRNELPNLVEDYRIPADNFTHADFILGSNLQQILYDRVLKVMKKFR